LSVIQIKKIRSQQSLEEQDAMTLWKLIGFTHPIRKQSRNGKLEMQSLQTTIYFLPELCDQVNTELAITSSQPFAA